VPYQRFPSLTTRVQTAALTGLDSFRYSYLQLSNAEPSFGLPVLSSGTYFLLSDAKGNRGFSTDISNYVLLTAADTKYFTVSGGNLIGFTNFLSDNLFTQSVSVLGDLTVFGQITSYKNTLVVVNVITAYPGNFVATGYISAGNIFYCKATGTKSLDWGSTFLTFKANSANYDSTYTSLYNNSARYETTFSTVKTLSTRWESVYNTTKSSSARWESSYNTLGSLSSLVGSNSSRWENAYTTVNAYSADWSDRSLLINNSGTWVSTYGTVSSLSGNWGGVYVYKNSNFDAERTGYYAVDTSSGIVRAALPSSPAIGDPVTFSDPLYTWQSSNFVVYQNGNNIEGKNESLSANIKGYNFTLLYVGGAQGWRVL
jgi:hypothetical protein